MKYVKSYVDRHGRHRQYFRRRGLKQIPLPGEPGTDEFAEAYQIALAMSVPPLARKAAYIPDWLERSASGVYFVKAGDRIKIGYSSKIVNRLSDIQIGSSLPVELLLVVPGTRDDERKFHRLFMHHRLHGEWFRLVESIEKFVADQRTKWLQV